LICQSESSLLLGFNKAIGAIEPSSGVYLSFGEQSDVALLAVSGDSGSGKTSTMRFLLGQAAMNGAALILCDPHGRKNQQSLVQSCGPLASSFLIPPAISWDDIHEAVAMVDRIGRNRLNDADDKTQIELVLDEFNDIARNAPDFKAIARRLNNVARSYRKVGITAILVAHNWRVNEWQSGTLKDACQAVLFHRLAKSEAKLFVADPSLAQQVAFLPHGDGMYFKRGAPAPVRLTGIPYVTRAHLDEARDLFTPAPRALPSMRPASEPDTDTPTGERLSASGSAQTVVSAYAHAPVSVSASVRPPALCEGTEAPRAPTDEQTHGQTSAAIPEAERVSVYLQAYADAGLTREQARERLARCSTPCAATNWSWRSGWH
jgi:hypothetical protein